MCGYLRRHIKPRTLRQFLGLLGLKSYGEQWNDNDETLDVPVMEHFYPAFGGNLTKQIKGLLISEGGKLKPVDATWWYDAEEVNGEVVFEGKQTLNARNLHHASDHAALIADVDI